MMSTSELLIVTACGRSVQVLMQDAQSIAMVKEVFQHELKMHGQKIELYDSVGTLLMTDDDLRMAVKKGTGPFTATLSEANPLQREPARGTLADAVEASQR